jgi:hypothetical protein
MKLFVCLLVLGASLMTADAQFNNFFRNVFGGGNNNNGNRGPPRGAPPPQQQQGPPQQGPPAAAGGGNCAAPPTNPNLINFEGRNYFPTWTVGCVTFQEPAADAYCRGLGMRAISLDTVSKTQWAIGLLGQSGQPWMWTGGNVSPDGVTWPNGVRQGVQQISPWSHTGGNNVPQPDNREGNEFCLAVLNNFYKDGIVFHDVACHHEKPTICEA